MLKEFEQRIIDVLMFEQKIPNNGIFKVSELLLKEYILLYGNIFGKNNGGVKSKPTIDLLEN
jgi:hypothetical protein